MKKLNNPFRFLFFIFYSILIGTKLIHSSYAGETGRFKKSMMKEMCSVLSVKDISQLTKVPENKWTFKKNRRDCLFYTAAGEKVAIYLGVKKSDQRAKNNFKNQLEQLKKKSQVQIVPDIGDEAFYDSSFVSTNFGGNVKKTPVNVLTTRVGNGIFSFSASLNVEKQDLELCKNVAKLFLKNLP